MTKLCYPCGCAAPLQVCRLAFWSSSPYVGDADIAWSVNFGNGYVYGNSRNVALPVRLVRAGQ